MICHTCGKTVENKVPGDLTFVENINFPNFCKCEAISITNGCFILFEGWIFIHDQCGALHHVPGKEVLEKMCKLYYGDDYAKTA